MQNVELFVNNLRNIYDKDDSSQETQKLIVEMQSFLNLSTFKDMKHEYRSRIFKEFWSFLFYSTRYSGNSTIRLSIIRTTALFIFQLISFYPTRIETAFADVLAEYAIDTLTATVAVPSYAILSYHQSPVTQDSFVSRCPVFHHICRKEALDYFPNTLSHFDHLKPEWHQSVLTNLLSKTFLKRQFNYWKLVVQIVSNNVNALFKVVFMAMFKQKDWDEILPMFAQLFFMNDAPHDSVNLYPIACFSLELIASETKQPISRITAALEILSLRTSSFQTKITMKVKGRTQIKEKVIENHEIIKNDQETKGNTDNLKNEQNNNEYNSIGENLNDLNVKNEVASIDKESLENGENNLKSILNHEKSHDEFDVGDDDVISITVSNKVNTITKDFNAKTFLTIPAFYDIGPPVEYLFPSEDDGFTILSVKLRNLIPHINNPKYTNKIINIVKAIINKPYDSYQSTCFQAIAQALPNINGQKERKLLFNELEKLFYSKSASWFHDLEILNIMKCYSGEFIIQTYGDSPRTANFFNQLIKFSKMSNDTLSQAAQDSMKLLSSSEQFVKTVMHQCDLFNPIDFQRTLQILSNNSCQNMTSQFIPLVFEAFDFYSYDKNVFTSICKFLSNFSLEKLPPSILNSCLLVLSATYTVITGISWIVTNNTNLESYEKVYQIIKESISTQPLDIITHKIFDYTNVLTLTVEVLNLIKSIEQIDASIIFDIIDHLFLLFPSLCTNIFWAHRGKLTTDQIITILNRFYIRIFYVPGSDVAKIWCQQIIIIIYNDPTKSDALRKTIDAMTKYTNKILSDVINGLNSNFNNIPNSTLHVFSKFNQLLSQEKIIIPETVGSKKNTPRIKKILHQKIKNAAKRKSVFPKIFKKDQLTLKFNLNDPIIETQLRYNTYKFSNDEISQLLSLFMKKSSKSGLHALCRYAKSNNLILPELNKSQNSLTLHHLKSMEKIKFKDLVHFSENQNNENSSEFLDFIFTQIYKDLKPKTISLYLIFLANILNRANKVKMKTASNIIEILNKNKNNFNIDLIMMVVALLSQKLPKKKTTKGLHYRLQTTNSFKFTWIFLFLDFCIEMLRYSNRKFL
ncbi:hypothetical protein TRFO_08323 [Tritrichomonas foetus]|uniref:Uncharacterized protein n=1 Tax=Tritrichomonas foetus TaxID=1144522 RepID=A0A1J4JKS3_9EUKA|nr:hypothetical protein TRFO_08323 [Tritrichomonas foetus]|eukprot:OHS99682.1 hypothetical protein TRFO_08323 [Tritrichomonas foetus]